MPHSDPSDPSTPTLRLGFLLAALVMVMAAANSALAAEGRWALAIGTATAAPQTAVEIPVVLSTNGARVSAIAFSVDFDASKLALDADPTLGSKVEIPAPTKFTSSSWVGTEAGAIGVAVYDRTRPIGVLADGTIARIRFRVLQGASGFAPVRVSLTKPYSAAGPSGEPLEGE
ncbi:MAG TPA: cohesin domain-containing protein, partial [Thermoanaerobaculia bacterium]|nr:cohesin domain-containing protein [Thermoanaerobaculia bacterium]